MAQSADKSALSLKLNQSIYQHSFLIFATRFFGTVAVIIVTYFFAHRLPTRDFGHYQNFWIQFYSFNAIAGLGLAAYVYTYSPSVIRQILRQLRLRHYFIGITIILLSSLVFGYTQMKAGTTFGLAALFLAFNTIVLILESLLIIFGKFKVLLLTNLAYFLAYLTVHILPLQKESFDFNHLLQMLLLALLAKLLIFLTTVIKLFKKNYGPSVGTFQSNYKRLWIHLYILDIAQILMTWADKFIVSLFLSKELSAIYANGTFAIPFLPLIFSAISSASLLQLAQTQKDKGTEATIMRTLGQMMANFAFPIFFFFFIFAEEFIRFYFSDKYTASVPIFRIFLLTIPLKAFNYTILLQHREKGAHINISTLIDIVVSLGLIYPLFKWLGIQGIALAFVIGTYIQIIYLLIINKRLLSTSYAAFLPLKSWTLKLLLFLVLTLLLHRATTQFLMDLPAMLSSIFFLALVALYLIFIDYKRERHVRH